MLRGINPSSEFPLKLPASKAPRFRACTAVATAIEELGYTSELGYQAFLYPNVPDMRKLLMWLVNKLPKLDGDQGDSEERIVGSGAVVGRAIKEVLIHMTGHS